MKYLIQKLNTNTWQQYVLFSQFIHRFDESEANDMFTHIFTGQKFLIDFEDAYLEGMIILAASEVGVQSFLVKGFVDESKAEGISKLSYFKVLADITDSITNYFCGMSSEAEYGIEIQKNLRKVIEAKGSSYVLSLLQDELRGRIP